MRSPSHERSEPCVYCGSTAPPRGREHVIPQAFGTFEQNLTLRCVCDDCNSYFCRTLELHLARDSAEGFLRLRHGVKPPSAANDLRNRRIATTIQEPGPYKGAHAVIRPGVTNEDLEPVPVPQVGFRQPGDAEFHWIPEEGLSEETVREYHGTGVHVRIVGRGDDSESEETIQRRLIARLSQLGITFVPQGEFHEPVTNAENSVRIETVFTVDIVIMRAIAKIAAPGAPA